MCDSAIYRQIKWLRVEIETVLFMNRDMQGVARLLPNATISVRCTWLDCEKRWEWTMPNKKKIKGREKEFERSWYRLGVRFSYEFLAELCRKTNKSHTYLAFCNIALALCSQFVCGILRSIKQKLRTEVIHIGKCDAFGFLAPSHGFSPIMLNFDSSRFRMFH